MPLLKSPTEFAVNYTTPDGALLIWKMEHLQYIDGFEVFIYNKEIRAQHPTGSPIPIKILHIPNNQTELLLKDLHWETKYRIVIFAVRGKDTTEKVEVSFRTDIFVEPVFTCNVKDIKENAANVYFNYKIMKRKPTIIFKYTIDKTTIAKEKRADNEEDITKVLPLRNLQPSTNYTVEVCVFFIIRGRIIWLLYMTKRGFI